jgi:tetratricopeptide (TPR) repeat protein
VNALYYLSQAYYLDGQPLPARDAILRAAKLAPRRADIAQKYGEYLCEYKLCQEGLRQLQKAQRLDPDLPGLDFDLGMAHLRLASVAEARQHLEVAVKKEPGNMVAARFLADVLHRSAEWQRARELYEIVTAREPRNAWGFYGLGFVLIALDRPEDALGPLHRSLELDPTIAKAHYQLGRALRLLDREDEARKEWELFRALRDRQEESERLVRAERTPFEERIWEECRRLLAQNEEAQALAYLNSVLDAGGGDPYYLLGALYFALGRGPDAVRTLTWATAITPDDVDALAYLGRAHVLEGAYARADAVLAQALELRPDSEQALVGMGELAYAQKQWSEAIQHFERSKTAQVPVLLKLCRANLMAHRREKALQTAAIVRAFAKQDPAALGELTSMLSEPLLSEEHPPAEVRPSP